MILGYLSILALVGYYAYRDSHRETRRMAQAHEG